jgi:hypothetical protein
MRSHESAWAATISAATNIAGAHVIAETADHAKTTTAAMTTPPAWSSFDLTASDVVLLQGS